MQSGGATIPLCSTEATEKGVEYGGCFYSYGTAASPNTFYFREKSASPSLAGKDCSATSVTAVRLINQAAPATLAGRLEVQIGGWWGTGEP